jgi:bifunctional DNase/RNase
LRDGTFFAKIKLDVASLDEVDSRPSDAIALALKFAVPIYVSEEVMNEVSFVPEKEDAKGEREGETIKEKEIEQSVEEVDPYLKKMIKLKNDLKSAVAKEDYEKAANLRDEIKRLELSR